MILKHLHAFLSLSRVLLLTSVMIALHPVAGLAQTTSVEDAQAATAPQQQVEVAPVASDVAIERRIKSILEATGWFRDIATEVDEGVVFLDGVTDTETGPAS